MTDWRAGFTVDPPRCSECGSIFREHLCHMVDPWIALITKRAIRRRG